MALCNICIRHIHVVYAGARATQEQLPRNLYKPLNGCSSQARFLAVLEMTVNQRFTKEPLNQLICHSDHREESLHVIDYFNVC